MRILKGLAEIGIRMALGGAIRLQAFDRAGIASKLWQPRTPIIVDIKETRKSLAGVAIEGSKPNWELKRIRIRTD